MNKDVISSKTCLLPMADHRYMVIVDLFDDYLSNSLLYNIPRVQHPNIYLRAMEFLSSMHSEEQASKSAQLNQ